MADGCGTHIGSTARTVQQLHNLLYAIDYTCPEDDRHTEEETANKILMCVSAFDAFFRGKCHDIINGEPGQRGNCECERGTPILALDEDGVAAPTGDYTYTYSLSLADMLTYFGKLWETRIESRDLPITSLTNDVSRSSEYEAHAAAPGPRRAASASGPRRAVSEHAFAATSAFSVRRPSGGFNRRNSLEALYAAGYTDMDSSFVTSSDFAALDPDELADALRNGGSATAATPSPFARTPTASSPSRSSATTASASATPCARAPRPRRRASSTSSSRP